MQKGKLIISLDFELIWGVFDHFNLNQNSQYFDNTLISILDVLNLFETSKIRATWATVGMLMNSNKEEWLTNFPNHLPNYIKSELSAYDYGKKVITSENEKYFFAPDLISKIIDTEGQEMGTHTYSHYYCLEEGQTADSFKDDLQLANQLSEKFKVKLNSLVFPRNQFNPEYISICNDFNIKTVRTNPDVWFWNTLTGESLQKKLFRSGDAYIPLANMAYKNKSISKHSKVIGQPASRFLRPLTTNSIVNRLRNARIKKEILNAAKAGEIYHLWWHPHNFGNNPNESLEALKDILNTFAIANKKYGMQSLNMNDVAMEQH